MKSDQKKTAEQRFALAGATSRVLVNLAQLTNPRSATALTPEEVKDLHEAQRLLSNVYANWRNSSRKMGLIAPEEGIYKGVRWREWGPHFQVTLPDSEIKYADNIDGVKHIINEYLTNESPSKNRGRKAT